MNASPKIEWLVVPAGVTVAGLAASEPLISLGAAAFAALLICRRPGSAVRSFGLAGAASAEMGDSALSHVFHAFSAGERIFPPSSSDAEEEAGSETGGETSSDRGSRAYEEFAAGLEEEGAEEISFLPPYASNDAPASSATPSTQASDAAGDCLIAGDLAGSKSSRGSMPVPRRFALGTVAIIRHLLEPDEVERILLEQRRHPRLRFGDVAVQLGLLSQEEVQELLVAQEQGLFSDGEIADARDRLASYHNG